MPERYYSRPCPLCQCDLDVTLETLTEDITIRPANLPPLVKDKLSVIAAYKREKGLGAAWQKAHGVRAIVYAATLLEAVGVHGGQLERALEFMTWLEASGKDWDLSSAPSAYPAFQAAKKEEKESVSSRCEVCGETFYSPGVLCLRHRFF